MNALNPVFCHLDFSDSNSIWHVANWDSWELALDELFLSLLAEGYSTEYEDENTEKDIWLEIHNRMCEL